MISVEAVEKELKRLGLYTVLDGIANAFDRWQDEKEYEDWKDYDKYIRGLITESKDCKIVKVSKRPFGVQVDLPKVKRVIQLSVTMSSAQWKTISKYN